MLLQYVGGHGNPLQYLDWRIPWTEEPGGLQPIESQRVGHNWSNLVHTAHVPFAVVDLFCLWKELNSEPSYTTILKPPSTYLPHLIVRVALKNLKPMSNLPPKYLFVFSFLYIPIHWKHIIALAWSSINTSHISNRDTIYWLTFYLFGHLSQLLY